MITKKLIILLVGILVSLLIGFRVGQLSHQKRPVAIGATDIQFLGGHVVITPQDLQEMTNEELDRYASLLFYLDRFQITQEETYYMGTRLLPRFFAKPQANNQQGEN